MHTLSPAQQRRRWWALGIVATAYVIAFFQRFAPVGITQELEQAFHTSGTALGLLAATYFYVYLVMQVPTGMLVDTLGPRRILLLGGLVGGAGSLLFGMASNLDMALAGRTLIGLGVSVTFIAMLKLIAVWFEANRFATLVGVCMLIGNLGSVLAGAPLTLTAQSFGWRGIFMGVGVVSLLLGAGCWLLVRDHPAEEHTATHPTARMDRASAFAGLRTVLTNPATWPSAMINVGVTGSFFAFGGLWAMPYLTQVHGMSRATASSHLSIYFAAFAIGAMLVGTLSDRLGHRKPIMLISTHLHALIWLVWLADLRLSPTVSHTLFALMGITTAGFTLSWACAKEVNPPHLSGIATSVVNMGGFLSCAVLQPLVGWVMDQHWQGAMIDGVRLYSPAEYQMGMLLLAGAAWFGAASAWWLRETNR
ncbi:putative L-galactonate transporter [Candidatus Magnetaquicoccaceae bacterium FCR-1]|uniref:L-galactonate transporter n=1 Tax=Candidatus Magnetaquiglobus chichijimensis TaxID=3141448 RepID=A0ABQ0CBS3_9PROT